MALIKCTECGKDISEQAVACPVCGKPMDGSAPQRPAVVRTRSATAGLKFVGFVLIVAGIFIGLSGGHGTMAAAAFVAGFVLFIAGRMVD